MKLLRLPKAIFFGTYARGFVSSYFFVALLGAILLSLPFSVQPGVTLSFTDAFFTAVSGLSVTGLSTIVVKDTFTFTGQMVLLFIIQFGGIGLIMLVALFWLAVRKKIGFRERNFIMADQNQHSRKGIVKFIRNVLLMIFIIEAIAFIIIALYLTFANYFVFTDALYHSLFMTVSLFTNAGFDIAPNADSFQMFKHDYFMMSMGMILMFLGSLGFWPLAEIKEFVLAKFHRESYRFSMFVKLMFILHISFWGIGAVLIILLETTHYFIDMSLLEMIYNGLFMSITTRNSGWTILNPTDLSDSTQFLFMALMFIGANPNSVGGGIRTTTFIIILLSIRAIALGREDIVIFKRTIKKDTILKSYAAMTSAVIIVTTAIIIINYIEPFTFKELSFEVVSAFGTTGLSLGVTPYLHTFSKFLLLLIMFIGRIGILALILMFKPSTKKKGSLSYPEIDIIVG